MLKKLTDILEVKQPADKVTEEEVLNLVDDVNRVSRQF